MSSSLVSGNAVVFTTSTGSNPVTATPTWSLGSGSNRGVILAFSHRQSGTGSGTRIASAVTVGGVTFTKIVGHVNGASPNYGFPEIWACNEASAASIGTNPTISITYANSGTGMAQGVIVTAQDCEQNLALWTDVDTDAQIATTTMTATLPGFASGNLVIGSVCDNSGLASYNCAATGGDATTEFTGSDVNFASSTARAVQFYATADNDPTYVIQRTSSSGSVFCSLVVAGIPAYSDPSATISSGTPSGTIGTQRRATLGATSTQSTGTFYGVISATQSDITGITAAQVYGALYAGGGAATFSGNNTVSDSTPDLLITGLTPATTYYYAVMHRVGTTNSNVVTGSFTTAVATSTASLELEDGSNVPLNAQTLNFWTRLTEYGAAVDGGTSGLSVTCNASGVFTFSGLNIDAGPGFITVKNPSDNTYSANYPVTFVAGV